MAEASSSSFDEWIRSLLNDLQSNDADMSDFVQYLLGIVTSESETDEEKQTAISELLVDLDLKHNHNIDNLSEQILHRWYQFHSIETRLENGKTNNTKSDDAINDALINAMNQIESNAKIHRSSNNSTKVDNDDQLKKHKTQILAKYSQVSDEEFDYDDEQESGGGGGGGLFQNNNAQDVDDRERKARELQHDIHKKQQEKNKIDAQNQKQKDDERKKKAQQRAQKQERRR